MGQLSAYLPQDRWRALARGETLPDHVHGSALFADISGYTALTEQLTHTLGARRGVEELTRRINAVYDALIRVIKQYGGSVVSFAGDSIMCWFYASNNQADVRQDYEAARDYTQQALVLAREIGAQQSIALFLSNLADADINLGQLAAGRAELREGLSLAQRLGALPQAVGAVVYFAVIAHAEGQTERALALWGLAKRHPAWSSDAQRGQDLTLAQWALDPALVEAGLAKGAELDWEETIQELLKG